MSAVKEFYLVGYSKCPKCGGERLKHLKTTGAGANFDCEDCKQRFDFGDYIKIALPNIEKKPFMQIFDRVYYEVNK